MRAIFFIMAMFAAMFTNAQTAIKTETFTVKGNCDDCKERIENAADIKGVKICKWDPETKVATVTYDSSKTDLSAIKNAIAKKGYQAGDVRANQAAYNKLPDCCKYDHGVCEDKKK